MKKISRSSLPKFEDKIKIEYVFQELDNVPSRISVPDSRVKPWGTGHAVLVAKEKISEPFAVINADDFYGASSFQLMHDYLEKTDNAELNACMVGFQLKNTISEHGSVSRGVCEIDEKGNLKSITERTKISKDDSGNISFEDGENKVILSPDQTVSMNLIGFSSKVFELIEKRFEEFIEENFTKEKAEFYIPIVLDEIARSSEVPVMTSTEKWLGVTYKEDKPVVMENLKSLVEQGLYPQNLWK